MPAASVEVGTGEAALMGGATRLSQPTSCWGRGLGTWEELWRQIMAGFCHTRTVASLAVQVSQNAGRFWSLGFSSVLCVTATADALA